MYGAAPAQASPEVELVQVGTYEGPVYVAAAPGDAHREFVVERGGRVWVMFDGQRLAEPFLDLSADVEDAHDDGLLSIAFAPDYATSRALYVNFTDNAGNIRLKEFRSVVGDPNRVDPASGRDLLSIPKPLATHAGGTVQFGTDGFLYMSVGDGASVGDPQNNAQNLDLLLGKLLRIDPTPSGGQPYTIPPSNPFVGTAGRDEIYAYGFRNPFRFWIDPSGLYLGDVGEAEREEVDYLADLAGGGWNFGWSCFEGTLVYNPAVACQDPVPPVHEYSHADGGCAVIGGLVAHDPGIPALEGRYLYGDLCTGEIRSFEISGGAAVDDARLGVELVRVTSIAPGAHGRIYVTGVEGGLYRLVQAPPCTVSGTEGDDVLTGGSGDDVICGLGGDDTLRGGAGSDRFLGGDGTDLVTYDDHAAGVSARIDGIPDDGAAGEHDNVMGDIEGIVGGAGADSLQGNVVANELQGGGGADMLDGWTGADTLSGGPGGDTLLGDLGSDTADGGEGDDTLDGGDGADELGGGAGTDTATYALRRAPLVVSLDDVADDGQSGEGDDVRSDVENLIGGRVADILIGSAAANALTGGNGNDDLRGLGGDDVLNDASGADTFRGGEGRDLVSYAARTGALSLSLDGSANDGGAGEADNLHADVEDLTGGRGNDVLVGSPGANVLIGGGGNDSIEAGFGPDTVVGGIGIDTASYSPRVAPVTVTPDGSADDGAAGELDDVAPDIENLTGGQAGDTLTGNGLANKLTGGSGDDTLRGLGGLDALEGGGDGDLLEGGADKDTLTGGAGDDVETGGDGDDTFVQEVQANGADALGGGAGADRVDYGKRGGAVGVSLDGAAGDGAAGELDNVGADVENVTGGSGADDITGSSAANSLTGGGGDDTLRGLDGNDALDGGGGGDQLEGGTGKDTSTGGAGDDVEAGGDGDDTFVQEAQANGRDALGGGAGVDKADYAKRTGAVGVSLDGAAGDGAAGELDNVGADVENVTGGSGADLISGSSANNALVGGAGADQLDGAVGKDTLTGGAGDDVEAGGEGDDTFVQEAQANGRDALSGGAGVDKADYAKRAGAVGVSLDGAAGDGAAGELDNVGADVENVTGGSGGDTISGSSANNALTGGGGADLLDGAGGDDTLTGGAGADVETGGEGHDTFVQEAQANGGDALGGGGGADRVDYSKRGGAVGVSLDGAAGDGAAGELDNVGTDVENVTGGSGADAISGSSAANSLVGGAGGDTLTAQDGIAGNDTVDGATGTDSCVADAGDTLRRCP